MPQIQDIVVSLADDGYLPPPAEMAQKLAKLTADRETKPDNYGNGGAVSELEADAARLLGKERAVMFPTGTLANLIAMRLLAGSGGGRVIVHAKSHLYNDSGENLSQLGGLTMVPLGGPGAGFAATSVSAEIARAADARVATKISCIAIESPNRRLYGQRFPATEIAEISAIAKGCGIPLALDGARMLIECAYSGRTPAEMAAPFEIVYLSLYKYLGAPFGCVLAGPAAQLDGLFHDRRRFGGSLYQMWPAAVLARDALAGFAERWAATIPAAETVLGEIARNAALSVERIPGGTNVALIGLRSAAIDGPAMKAAGIARGIKLPDPDANRVPVKINETWMNLDPKDLACRVSESLMAGAGAHELP